MTGANKGLGLETARQLTRQGVFVIFTARNGERLRQTEELGLEGDFILLDVTDPESIARAAREVEAKYGRLDILINNAGIASEMARPPINNSVDIPIGLMREVFETNVFGVIAVTQAMLPLLRKSEAGRIVNLSSGLGSLAQHSDSAWPLYHLKTLAYNSSKAALNQFTVHLAAALSGTGIKVNSVSPGWARTDLGGPYAPLSPEEGAMIIVRAALLGEDGPTGRFFTHDMQGIPW